MRFFEGVGCGFSENKRGLCFNNAGGMWYNPGYVFGWNFYNFLYTIQGESK